jgi:hypothetical protein
MRCLLKAWPGLGSDLRGLLNQFRYVDPRPIAAQGARTRG